MPLGLGQTLNSRFVHNTAGCSNKPCTKPETAPCLLYGIVELTPIPSLVKNCKTRDLRARWQRCVNLDAC